MNDEKELQNQQPQEADTQPADTGAPAQPEAQAEPAPHEHKAEKPSGKHHAELAAAKAKAEELAEKLAQSKETLLRTAAEYDNYRKRSAKEHDAAFGKGVGYAVEKLLPVLDTLELAANAPTQDESYKKGVLMTLDKCKEAFAAMGVEEIDALNKPFDHELCAAVMQQPAPEGVESGTVLQVLQKGYTLNGKVIRHATVAVAE
jgi:molecular chaperone GrpE